MEKNSIYSTATFTSLVALSIILILSVAAKAENVTNSPSGVCKDLNLPTAFDSSDLERAKDVSNSEGIPVARGHLVYLTVVNKSNDAWHSLLRDTSNTLDEELFPLPFVQVFTAALPRKDWDADKRRFALSAYGLRYYNENFQTWDTVQTVPFPFFETLQYKLPELNEKLAINLYSIILPKYLYLEAENWSDRLRWLVQNNIASNSKTKGMFIAAFGALNVGHDTKTGKNVICWSVNDLKFYKDMNLKEEIGFLKQ